VQQEKSAFSTIFIGKMLKRSLWYIKNMNPGWQCSGCFRREASRVMKAMALKKFADLKNNKFP
jgi:hypothetical protein